jgi:hypothetical protein
MWKSIEKGLCGRYDTRDKENDLLLLTISLLYYFWRSNSFSHPSCHPAFWRSKTIQKNARNSRVLFSER